MYHPRQPCLSALCYYYRLNKFIFFFLFFFTLDVVALSKLTQNHGHYLEHVSNKYKSAFLFNCLSHHPLITILCLLFLSSPPAATERTILWTGRPRTKSHAARDHRTRGRRMRNSRHHRHVDAYLRHLSRYLRARPQRVFPAKQQQLPGLVQRVSR